jgi:hypothetical protein
VRYPAGGANVIFLSTNPAVPQVFGRVSFVPTISAEKFEQTYDFRFEESVESIVKGLVHGSNGRSDDAVYATEALSGV